MGEFFHIVQPVRYGIANTAELEDALAKRAASRRLIPLFETKGLELGPDGKTRGTGYRYTHTAFAQVAVQTARGLAGLVEDLAGVDRPDESTHRRVDQRAAATIFNLALSARGEEFRGLRLLCDDRQKTIEGLVGGKIGYLTSQDFYAQVSAALAKRSPAMVLHEAVFGGGCLSLRYRMPDSLFTVELRGKRKHFYECRYFFHDESLGRGIRAYRGLVTKSGACLAGGPRCPISRSIPGFQQKLQEMLHEIAGKDLSDVDELQRAGGSLAELRLFGNGGFIGSRSALSDAFCALGWARKVADEIVAGALLQTRVALPAAAQTDAQRYGTLTALDLFDSMCSVARDLDYGRRENLEKLAFRMLTAPSKALLGRLTLRGDIRRKHGQSGEAE